MEVARLEEAESAGAGAARPPPESVRTEVARLEEAETAGADATRRRGSVEAAVLARGDAPGWRDWRQSTPAAVVPRDSRDANTDIRKKQFVFVGNILPKNS